MRLVRRLELWGKGVGGISLRGGGKSDRRSARGEGSFTDFFAG